MPPCERRRRVLNFALLRPDASASFSFKLVALTREESKRQSCVLLIAHGEASRLLFRRGESNSSDLPPE